MFKPSHFAAVLLSALFTSVVFAITGRDTPRRMVNYGIYCFAVFVGSVVLISWLMFLIAR